MASFAPDSNDPLAMLMQLIDRVRAGEMRIENFRMSVSPASFTYDGYTVSGRVTPTRVEPPSAEFEFNAVADSVGTGRTTTPCNACDGRGYKRSGGDPISRVCPDCEGKGMVAIARPSLAVTQLEGFSSTQGVKLLDNLVSDTELANPWEPEFWNVTAQGAYVTKYGMEKAKSAATEAGSYIGATAPAPPFCIVRTDTGSVRLALLPTSTFVKRLSEYVSRFKVQCVKMPQRSFNLLVAEGVFDVTGRGFDPDNMMCCGVSVLLMKSKNAVVKQPPKPKPTPPSQPPKQTRELIFDE